MPSGRLFVPLVIFAIIAVVFFARLIYLQVIMADTYSAMAQEARTANIETTPRRGTIYDCNGNVLAISMEATTIYVNPAEVTDAVEESQALAEVLGGEAEDYYEKLTEPDITFVYIKRKADVETAQRVQELGLDGIYFIEDTRREYPYGFTGGQVIGFCNTDGEGICGLELYYDDILRGTPGRLVAERARNGSPIPGGVHEEVPAVDGQDIMVSLDIELQGIVEERLKATKDKMGASSTSCVIMDADTGNLIAIASLPLFNPADVSVVEEGATTLAPISSPFEPGSMYKTVAAMAILETGTMGPDDTIYCPAEIQADEYWVSDAHDRDGETMSLRDIIDRSSNVGISLSTEKMGFETFYEKINAYHLNDLTGVDYPGETIGYLLDIDQWSKIQGYSATFGQGLSVTSIELVRFYAGIANNGYEPTPHFLVKNLTTGETPEYTSEEVIQNKEAVATMVDMLRTVVTSGTGTLANIDGFTVCGKTSTAEIASPKGGYRTDAYNLGFTGFLSGASSQLVCFVGANEVPYEGTVTPVFRDIMTKTIEHLRIAPE